MNIALVGYGKMGKQIEKVLNEKNINISAIIDKFSKDKSVQFIETDYIALKGVDVVIDFSTPEELSKRVCDYISNKVNVVMGTTGWYDNIEKIKNLVGNHIGLIWSGNFSLGVNIFFKVLKYASSIFNNISGYDPIAYEIHHKEKKDSPSGTALMMGDVLLKELNSKNVLTTDKIDRKIKSEEIHLASIRGGYFPGTHVVEFDSPADTIELKHTARTREGFAIGAVMAADWIKDKKGFYSISDFLDSIIVSK